MAKHFITVTFEVPDYQDPPNRGCKLYTYDEVIELVRAALENQPFDWTLDEYERDPSFNRSS